MNIILSILFPVLKSLSTKIQNDAGCPGLVVVGIVVIVLVGAVIITLIVLAVKFLIRLKNKKTNHD